MDCRMIVVGADLGGTGDEAIRVGLEQVAEGTVQGMFVVHAVSGAADDTTVQSLARRVAQIAEREHIPYYEELVRVEVREGEVEQALIDAAREHHADLLIVGTHGRRGLERVLSGSVAESLVRRASCSVLVARPPAHTS